MPDSNAEQRMRNLPNMLISTVTAVAAIAASVTATALVAAAIAAAPA